MEILQKNPANLKIFKRMDNKKAKSAFLNKHSTGSHWF